MSTWIFPYLIKRKSRILVTTCIYKLTNNCVIQFEILDLKSKKTYDYNFENKPTNEVII